MQHRFVGSLTGILSFTAFEQQLSLEDLSFRRRQIELNRGNYLASAFSDADVINAVFTRIPPIAEIEAILAIGRHAREILNQLSHLSFPNAFDELLKAFTSFTAHHISFADAFHQIGNILGRNGYHRESVRSCVVRPFSAEHYLKMRHRISRHFATHAIETKIGNMVLPATVETAADLDVKTLNGLIQLHALCSKPRAQLRCQPAR